MNPTFLFQVVHLPYQNTNKNRQKKSLLTYTHVLFYFILLFTKGYYSSAKNNHATKKFFRVEVSIAHLSYHIMGPNSKAILTQYNIYYNYLVNNNDKLFAHHINCLKNILFVKCFMIFYTYENPSLRERRTDTGRDRRGGVLQ